MSSSGSASSSAACLDFDRRLPVIEIDRRDGRRFDLDRGARLAGSHLGASRLGGRQFVRRRPCDAVGGGSSADCNAGSSAKAPAGRRLRLRPDRLGRGQKLVGMARRGAPDRATAHAAHLAPVRLQACQLDIVGCSAGRADDQHWRIRAVGSFCGDRSSRSVNGLETKPARAGLPDKVLNRRDGRIRWRPAPALRRTA